MNGPYWRASNIYQKLEHCVVKLYAEYLYFLVLYNNTSISRMLLIGFAILGLGGAPMKERPLLRAITNCAIRKLLSFSDSHIPSTYIGSAHLRTFFKPSIAADRHQAAIKRFDATQIASQVIGAQVPHIFVCRKMQHLKNCGIVLIYPCSYNAGKLTIACLTNRAHLCWRE